MLIKSLQLGWTEEEDSIIFNWKQPEAWYDFSELQSKLPHRLVGDVRDRWLGLVKTPEKLKLKWTNEEWVKFYELYEKHGTNVEAYLPFFPERTRKGVEAKVYEYRDKCRKNIIKPQIEDSCTQTKKENPLSENEDIIKNIKVDDKNATSLLLSSLEKFGGKNSIFPDLLKNQSDQINSENPEINLHNSLKEEKMIKVEDNDTPEILLVSKPNRIFGACLKRRLLKNLRKSTDKLMLNDISKFKTPERNRMKKSKERIKSLERKKWIYYMNRRFI